MTGVKSAMRKSSVRRLADTLPADLLRPILSALKARNPSAFSALDQLCPEKLPESVLTGAIASVERPVFAELYGRSAVALAAAISGDPRDAQEYASRVEFMLTVLRNSATLRDAVDSMTRFNALMGDHGVMITACADEGFDRIVIDLDPSLPDAPACLWTACILFILNMLSWLRGVRITVAEIGLTDPADTEPDPCLAYLAIPVLMGQADCYIRLATGTLEEPVSAHADSRTGDLHLLCHDPGYWHEAGTSFLMQVDQAFTRITEGSGRCPDRVALAHALGLSPSTLHRRLQQNGTSFQRVKIAWQHKTALFLIGRGDTIYTVARHLGFTDARSFRRAFIAWTGRTPSWFRASFRTGAHGESRAGTRPAVQDRTDRAPSHRPSR